jgi:hypothetical protein
MNMPHKDFFPGGLFRFDEKGQDSNHFVRQLQLDFPAFCLASLARII